MSRTKFANAVVGLAVTLAVSVATISAMVATSPEAGSTTSTATSLVSVSFIPSGEGWILSGYHCKAGTCVKVERTLNEGQSWTSIPIPSQLQRLVNETASAPRYVPLSIYFADAKDGWIYGSAQRGASSTGAYSASDAELWATHDGGETWSSLSMRSLGMTFNVLSVGASRGQVYAIGWRLSGQSFGLWRSSVATDSWQRVTTPALPSAAGGASMEGALIFRGTNGWLMVGNDRGVTGSARLTSSGQWVKWAAPCASVGGGFSVPVATSATTLVDVCTIGGFGGYLPPSTPRYLKLESNWIFTSHNGGLTFLPTLRVVINGSSQGLDQLPSLPASPSTGAVLVAKSVQIGQSFSDHLYMTKNGGKTWRSVYATPPSKLSPEIQFVTFASSSLGYAIVQIGQTTSKLIISTDGGRTWH